MRSPMRAQEQARSSPGRLVMSGDVRMGPMGQARHPRRPDISRAGLSTAELDEMYDTFCIFDEGASNVFVLSY